MDTEAQTRKAKIDLHLRAASWDIDDPIMVTKELSVQQSSDAQEIEEGKGYYNSNMFCDYPSSTALIQPPLNCGKYLAKTKFLFTFITNTRAVPLVRKEDAHQGRVFFCPHLMGRLS